MFSFTSTARLFRLPLLAVCGALILGNVACSKDDDAASPVVNVEPTDPRAELNDELDGDWDVESWTVDGVEFIGSFVTSFEMEFEKQDDFDGEADWRIIYGDGGSDRLKGDYEVENGGREIDFDNIDIDVDMDGDEMTLEMTYDGMRWIIQAERD